MRICTEAGCKWPGPDFLDNLCEEHFRARLVSKLELRKQRLRELSVLEKEISVDVEKLTGDPQRVTRPSILHRCTCGFSSLSYIEVDSHIDDYNGGHAHAPRESLGPLHAPKARQRSGALPSVATDFNPENLG